MSSSSLLFDIESLEEDDNKRFYWKLIEKEIDIFYCSCLREYFRDNYSKPFYIRGLNQDTESRLHNKNNCYSPCCAIYLSEINKIIDDIKKDEDEENKEDLINRLIGLRWIVAYIFSIHEERGVCLNDEDIRIIFYIGN